MAKSLQHLQPLGGGAVTEGDLNDFCGCPDSLLGVSPEALKLSHLPDLPARQVHAFSQAKPLPPLGQAPATTDDLAETAPAACARGGG